MTSLIRRLAKKLPPNWQQEIKRWYYRYQISRNRFLTTEQEFTVLDQMVRPGDCVIDVGANVGHYTARLSALVGPRGRVIAFEPIPRTFALLASNLPYFPHPNVTLVNAAVSEKCTALGMRVPLEADGAANYYQARIIADSDAELQVLAVSIDALGLPMPVSLVKIDAEGHDFSVLRGMVSLLRRDLPTLIVEDNDPELGAYLELLGYQSERLPGSHNLLFKRAFARPVPMTCCAVTDWVINPSTDWNSGNN